MRSAGSQRCGHPGTIHNLDVHVKPSLAGCRRGFLSRAEVAGSCSCPCLGLDCTHVVEQPPRRTEPVGLIQRRPSVSYNTTRYGSPPCDPIPPRLHANCDPSNARSRGSLRHHQRDGSGPLAYLAVESDEVGTAAIASRSRPGRFVSQLAVRGSPSNAPARRLLTSTISSKNVSSRRRNAPDR